MKNFVKKLVKGTDKFAEVLRLLCCFVSACFMLMMFVQVVLRYVFNSPIYGIDEMVTCLMIWYSSIGTALVLWEEAHAMIVFFLKFFPKKFQWVVEFCENLIIYLGAYVFIKAGQLLFKMQIKTLPVGGLPFSRVYYYATPMIVMGVLLIIFETVRFSRFLFNREDYEARERKGDN